MNDHRATSDVLVPQNPCKGATLTGVASICSPRIRDYVTQPRALWQGKAVSLHVVSPPLLNKFTEN